MSSAIMQLAAMCQRASDETAGAQRQSSQTKDACEKLWLDQAAMERFGQEQRLRAALLCTPAEGLADALVLATNLSAYVPDEDEAETVEFTGEDWRSIHVAIQNLTLVLAAEIGVGDLTAIDATTVRLWQGRASRRGLAELGAEGAK